MLNLSNQAKQIITSIHRSPQAAAVLRGSNQYESVKGNVLFYRTNKGVLVIADVSGLPNPLQPCKSPVFGFHIHEGRSCTGDMNDPFADAMTHYNPGNCPHPFHAGDLPPLFGNNGYAFEAFLTDRFSVSEIIGLTVIVHSQPDDFTTQPSGNSGEKIACGIIQKFY